MLVVAADDGVMPQTIESINHAKAAGVPIVVALNKIDKPEATDNNIQKILGQLAEHELNPSEWGGDTEVIRTSAAKGTGIQELLEVLDYRAQLLELKADFGGRGRGTVIEAKMEEGRGPVANILVQEGTSRSATSSSSVAASVASATSPTTAATSITRSRPPTPVPSPASTSARRRRQVLRGRRSSKARRGRRAASPSRPRAAARPAQGHARHLFSQMAESEVKEILIVLKADVQGSVDVLRHEIEGVSTSEVKVRVLHAAVGGITESDVLLAEASKAIVIGFNVIPSGKARSTAEQRNVEIRTYDVIYHITEDVKKAAEGMLEPELRQEVLGHAEVRQVFKISKVGTSPAATSPTAPSSAMRRFALRETASSSRRTAASNSSSASRTTPRMSAPAWSAA